VVVVADPITLPPRVRRVLVEFAAQVLGTMTEPEAPVGLRKIRRFAPASRAKAGAVPLALALDRDQAFRRQVAAAWRTAHPELSAGLEAGSPIPALDPVAVVVGIYLVRPEGWELQLVSWLDIVADQQAVEGAEAVEREEQAGEAGTDSEGDSMAAVQEALAQARAEITATEAARAELAQELVTLRREQRRLRSDADRARSATREAERRASEEAERLGALLAERDGLLRQAERQAAEAQEQLASAKRSAKDGRSLAELRARLLLDTIVESASALRRELALPPASQTPADLVTEQLVAEGAIGDPATSMVRPRGLADDDPALLLEMLRIPRAHLLVDGYNVTMEGYGGLPLVDQRRLLIDAMSALAARTSAEITCCFDGAEVEGRSPSLVRGVRVLFSEPGTTADTLIGRLVRAEPRGRMLVVVSSDREVADSAIAAAARPVASTVLLRLIGAGQRDRRR
jgi:predicted RNA-binding protein with PIN domain